MAVRLTPREQVDIIHAYTIGLEPMVEIAKRYNKTRQGIYKVIKRAGINPAEYGRLAVSCTACGEVTTRPRCQVRNRRHLFCSQECYYGYLEGKQQGEYNGNRHGQRIARAVVSQYFELKPGHIVHHEDRNTRNNEPRNLRVFANQGDHIRYHRWGADGIEIKPVWDGSLV